MSAGVGPGVAARAGAARRHRMVAGTEDQPEVMEAPLKINILEYFDNGYGRVEFLYNVA